MSKNTDHNENELFTIISRLLVLKFIIMVRSDSHWTVNPFDITEQGLFVLEPINKKEIITYIFMGITAIVAVIGLFT